MVFTILQGCTVLAGRKRAAFVETLAFLVRQLRRKLGGFSWRKDPRRWLLPAGQRGTGTTREKNRQEQQAASRCDDRKDSRPPHLEGHPLRKGATREPPEQGEGCLKCRSWVVVAHFRAGGHRTSGDLQTALEQVTFILPSRTVPQCRQT